MAGTLYIVATPIGNLEDMTLRSIRVLKEVDTILSEDTRTTKNLLNHYEIKTPLISYHSNATGGKHDFIVRELESGKNIALVSDAGTPGISDPGNLLVDIVRKEIPGVSIIPIPGASALTSALSVSGMKGNHTVFLGFLPQKKGRQTALTEIGKEVGEKTFVFFESTHRILKLLAELKKHLPSDAVLLLCRELTKKFEETLYGSPEELMAILDKNPQKVRGEFVVIIGKHIATK